MLSSAGCSLPSRRGTRGEVVGSGGRVLKTVCGQAAPLEPAHPCAASSPSQSIMEVAAACSCNTHALSCQPHDGPTAPHAVHNQMVHASIGPRPARLSTTPTPGLVNTILFPNLCCMFIFLGKTYDKLVQELRPKKSKNRLIYSIGRKRMFYHVWGAIDFPCGEQW